ncbi:hypothetical protein [Rhodoferax saidenbachensis]|nr:hypothetical protein [Rhodoferax saidenbachensis]
MTHTPLLWPSILTPAAEIAEVKSLYALLTGVECSAKGWDAALALYRTSLSPPNSISKDVASRWRWIACNECILELYHLRSRMEKIQAVQLRKCPSLLPWIDSAVTRSARKRLDDHFPDIEALRHATAHKGENEVNPNAHAPEGQQFALTGFREPHRYSTPYLGKMRSLDITNESLIKVVEVVDAYLSAFEPAAEELERQGHLE